MTTQPLVPCPFTLTVEPMARFLNCELDDPVYDGLELQWWDDAQHGTGMLAFLSRRADRRVDFYADPALTLDRSRFAIGAGIGSWQTITFDAAHLEIFDDGVTAEVRFTDREGRPIEVSVDDRDGHGRHRAKLLAPVGSGIDHPLSLLLVHLHGFDLLRRGRRGSTAEVRIDGRAAGFGTLPGRALHRRELVKYAGPVDVITLNEAHDGALPLLGEASAAGGGAGAGGAGAGGAGAGGAGGAGAGSAGAGGAGAGGASDALPTAARASVRLAGGGVGSVVAGEGPSRVRLEFRPAFPGVAALGDGEAADGLWRVCPEDVPPLTGGTWRVARSGDVVDLGLEVTERWQPGRLPALMELVTRVVPVFRRWPTTYRWRATVTLGEEPTMVSRWERTGERDDSYSRATGSAPRGKA